MVCTLLAPVLLGRCLALAYAASDLYGEPLTSVDFLTETSASSAFHPLSLLQTMTSKVLIASPENATNNSQESNISMADFYQQASAKAAALPMGALARTMADIYQEAFQAESQSHRRSDIHPPSMLRAAYWVGVLMLASLTTFTLFVVALGWVPGTRMYKLVRRSAPSRLLGQCVDIDVVPSGTVCAVCLEDASDTCDKDSHVEGSAEDDAHAVGLEDVDEACKTQENSGLEDVDEACKAQKSPGCPADDGVKPLAGPALGGPSKDLGQGELQTKLLHVPPCEWCRTPCGHCFHRACLEKWLNSAAKERCPLCNWQ